MAEHEAVLGEQPSVAQWRVTDALIEPDEQLAVRAAYDAEAFAELYRRYAGPVRRYCAFRIHDKSSIEDVTSQVFVQALEGLRNSSVSRVRPWIFTIAHHKIVDFRRRWRETIDIDETAELASHAPGPEELAIGITEVARLRQAIAQLSPDQMRVIELRLSGLDGPEIRQVLGRTRSWVDTTQYRALIRLRSLLTDDRSPEVS
jgi:RNA polymerase sigma-70 factor (ECF subfamily)